MRVAWVYFLLWAGLGTAQSQQGAAAFIESRQTDVSRLAPVYFIDLGRGDWKHEQFYPCPAFTHHVFARYERSAASGVISSFVAVFPLNAPHNSKGQPSKSGILLIPSQTFASDSQIVAERRSTQLTFNRIWSDELKASGHPDTFPALDWGGLAECYAAISGQEPAPVQIRPPSSQLPPSIDLKSNIVSSIMMSVNQPGAPAATLRLAFDPHGMIANATLK